MKRRLLFYLPRRVYVYTQYVGIFLANIFLIRNFSEVWDYFSVGYNIMLDQHKVKKKELTIAFARLKDRVSGIRDESLYYDIQVRL